MRLVLYDLEGVKQPWSCNTIQSRLALYYKKLPFETVWLKYPEIEPTAKSLGCGPWPAEQGYPAYTVPILSIEHENGKKEHVMGTKEIARRLDELRPPANLRVDQADEIRPALIQMFGTFPTLEMHISALISRDCLRPLSEENADWFDETRAKHFYGGQPLAKHIEADPELLKPEGLKKAMQGFGPLLANSAGPFLHGAEPCFGDFKLGAFLIWLMIADKELFDKMVAAADPALRRLLDALDPYWPGPPK